MKKRLILSLLAVSLVFTSCFKDKDDDIQIASVAEIQNFIYRGLNYFYLYKADTAELANDAFTSEEEKNTFITSFDTPEALFDYLKSPQDRFSILVDNYIELENALSGITLNNGMEFGLVFYPNNSGNVFGYIRYVIPNTAASSAGLQRGVIFNTVDGQQITENNFSELLTPDEYTIGLATFDGTEVTPTSDEVTLTKTQVSENPIHVAQTLNVSGHTIGYLMYNAFTSEFDSQLNGTFAQFQADGVTDLVLDLRYNGGGSVRTATYLTSMITGQFTGDLLYTEEWNADRQNENAENGVFPATFEGGSEIINNLGLSRVYILTTGRTASASELVINTLNPYINVIQIGGATTGKFQASFLLYDAPAPGFSRSEANQGHTYAMLPLVFKTANSVGFTDYVDGLTPNIELGEDYSNLGILGDANEPLLAVAIADIVGQPRPFQKNLDKLEEISESKANSPIYQLMIAEQ
ncbi:S41 family peptidase [Ulvibacter antarcticus]|uniref:Peptidase S41-like protein n=1 Tax=Ulvibacter antarcticus TaxID=442714 RepID=A0A3L9YVD4_9FLAO|nr:S41 family peptidase [Ulvibacter antarcticus]RMA64626.1 peptidase S41-like protein [Ulvibacter antarcticus]